MSKSMPLPEIAWDFLYSFQLIEVIDEGVYASFVFRNPQPEDGFRVEG